MSIRQQQFQRVVRSAVARRGVAIMGICNVTPDSFSDGGLYFHTSLDLEKARARVQEMLAEGADIIDIGGESTRPGAKPVSPREQIARTKDLVELAAKLANENGRACVSIDTTSPEVAAACLDAGAHAVNDVSLLSDPELASVSAGSGAALILSHARGSQETMSGGAFHERWPLSAYDDVVSDVLVDWERAAAEAMRRGLARDALVMDPGLGFSKASRHSFELLRRCSELVARAGVPVLIGASRKSFLTLVDPATKAEPSDPSRRLGASIAAALHAARAGASIVRVHDVQATRQALDADVVLRLAPGHGHPGKGGPP